MNLLQKKAAAPFLFKILSIVCPSSFNLPTLQLETTNKPGFSQQEAGGLTQLLAAMKSRVRGQLEVNLVLKWLRNVHEFPFQFLD